MSAATQPAPLPDFRDIADRANLPQRSMRYVRGQVSTIALEKTGYLASINGVVTINVTTGATGSYANPTNIPSPECAIREIRLRTNTGVNFHVSSGFDLYLLNRVQKLYDYRNPQATFDGADANAQVFQNPTPSAVSTTYQYRFPVNLRNVLGERELLSLYLLEGKAETYLDITWQDLETQFLVMTGTTPSLTINSVTFTPENDIFLIPQRPHVPPAYSPVKIVYKQQDALSTTGIDKFIPLNGGTLLRAIMYYQNGDGTRIPLSSFGNYSLKFGGIMQPERGTIQNLAARQLRQYEGFALPAGVIVHDYMGGNGDGSRQPGLRDTIPLRDANDLVIETEILPTVTLTAGATRTVILELLKPSNKL